MTRVTNTISRLPWNLKKKTEIQRHRKSCLPNTSVHCMASSMQLFKVISISIRKTIYLCISSFFYLHVFIKYYNLHILHIMDIEYYLHHNEPRNINFTIWVTLYRDCIRIQCYKTTGKNLDSWNTIKHKKYKKYNKMHTIKYNKIHTIKYNTTSITTTSLMK